MTYAFGPISEARLKDLHPDLVRVYRRAMSWQLLDFMILETVRTQAAANDNAAKGTGIKSSKHLRQPDGFAHACDAVPYPVDWKDTKRFDFLAGVIAAAAKVEDVAVRWGGNWDGDNDFHDNSLEDLPHFELVA
ncbi:MAG: hypothetical protein J0I79_16430 [Mesorhizobium sp.]|uniref:hypothetical protein n=1 Tax=Mesorhizobium sp. TaxID=1871066 RepID=UPI001AD51AB9|nr:hypothetical protein [Mesorhizobium sp.]MBN9219533.1 hypothetical protein [Mesorhizobium sp.]